jgi:hypothetical protein
MASDAACHGGTVASLLKVLNQLCPFLAELAIPGKRYRSVQDFFSSNPAAPPGRGSGFSGS